MKNRGSTSTEVLISNGIATLTYAYGLDQLSFGEDIHWTGLSEFSVVDLNPVRFLSHVEIMKRCERLYTDKATDQWKRHYQMEEVLFSLMQVVVWTGIEKANRSNVVISIKDVEEILVTFKHMYDLEKKESRIRAGIDYYYENIGVNISDLVREFRGKVDHLHLLFGCILLTAVQEGLERSGRKLECFNFLGYRVKQSKGGKLQLVT